MADQRLLERYWEVKMSDFYRFASSCSQRIPYLAGRSSTGYFSPLQLSKSSAPSFTFQAATVAVVLLAVRV